MLIIALHSLANSLFSVSSNSLLCNSFSKLCVTWIGYIFYTAIGGHSELPKVAV